MKKYYFLLLCLFFIGCRDEEKSKEYYKKAFDVYNTISLDKKQRIDSSLKLIDLAIDANKDNFNAYYQKMTYLVETKNLSELIKNCDKMLELRSEQPYWLLQKGLYLELSKKKNRSL